MKVHLLWNYTVEQNWDSIFKVLYVKFQLFQFLQKGSLFLNLLQLKQTHKEPSDFSGGTNEESKSTQCSKHTPPVRNRQG